MKPIIATLAALILLTSTVFAYDINNLLAEARAHYQKYESEFDDLSVYFEGTFTAAEAKDSKITSVHYMKGNKWRNEGTMDMQGMMKQNDMEGMPPGMGGGNMEVVALFDGTDMWTLAMGMKMKMPKDQVPGNMSTPAYWQEPIAGSEIVGDESVNGRDCWIVLAPENSIMKTRPKTWIDKKHFVFVRSESELSDGIMRTDFSDFRTVEGDFVVPYHYEVSSEGRMSMSGGITSLETNSGLSDDLFDPEKLGGSGGGESGMPGMGDIDIDALMKQAEEMKKKYGGGKKD